MDESLHMKVLLDGYRMGIDAAARLADADLLMPPGKDSDFINDVRANIAQHIRGLATDLDEVITAKLKARR